MRLTRLYHPGTIHCGERLRLDSQASAHLVRVLRARSGSRVQLFNGDGYNYDAILCDANPRKAEVEVESRSDNPVESPLNICLIQGLSRQDRMETTIQKSVELGVTNILPLLCRYSSVKLPAEKWQKKQQHWQNVAISACEQSGRSIVPEVLPVASFDELPARLNDNSKRYMLLPQAPQTLNSITQNLSTPKQVSVLIGPEGGLCEKELDVLETMNFTAIRFGPRILRTETAGPAVISAMQLLWGDLSC